MPFAQEVTVQSNVPATMRDGVVLMSNVYRPADDGKYPVLLTRLPYGKDGPRDAAYFDPLKAASRGYVVVVQDVRGRYASGGRFSSFPQEFADGYDSVEWAANLPGSNGRVGMWGLSYYGKTQWQAAVMGPPSLAALAPAQTWGDHWNGASLRGGAQELGLVQNWALGAIAPDLLFRRYSKDPQALAANLPKTLGRIDELLYGGGYDALPLSNLPSPEDLPTNSLGLGRGVEDGFWDEVNVSGSYDRVNVPTFHIGGWYDCFIGETLLQYRAMKDLSEKTGNLPPRLIVGPWTHGDFGSFQGELEFGVGSSGLFVDGRESLADLQLRFFDATLKGEGTFADERAVKVFVMGENRWRALEDWPPPGAREEDWHLHPDGRLCREASKEDLPDEYDYEPSEPVPTLGGATLLPPVHGSGPLDQRPIESRPDVLVYTSEPFGSDVTLLGPVHATLFASSSAPDTDFVVRLTDVHPDGRSVVLADGIVRASARESYPRPGVVVPTEPSPIEPGEVYEYSVDLWATAVTLKRGHRLRAHVTSSSFPRWDRNPNTGRSGYESGETRVARQKVFRSARYPSRVTITLVD